MLSIDSTKELKKLSIAQHIAGRPESKGRPLSLMKRDNNVTSNNIAASVRTNVAIPLRGGVASFITFNGLACGAEHFAVQFGAIEAKNTPIVRMHSECVTGDVFGSLRCDCGSQLNDAIDKLQNAGGILLYLRQEGRGIGLLAKLDAYKLQDSGLDTYAANRALSLPDDARDYACGAAMLHALGVHRIRLLTNNPDKAVQLTLNGIEIEERLPTDTFLTEFNRDYLTAKALLTNHRLVI